MKSLFVAILSLAGAGLVAAEPPYTVKVSEPDAQSTEPARLVARRPTRNIMLDSFVRIRDDEWDGDEIFNRDPAPRTIPIGNEYGNLCQDYFEVSGGGEIPIEVRTNFTLLYDQYILGTCFLDLYEGTTESTGDHDGHTEGFFMVCTNKCRSCIAANRSRRIYDKHSHAFKKSKEKRRRVKPEVAV
jgi:hypothetical protein